MDILIKDKDEGIKSTAMNRLYSENLVAGYI
jgi:hypothetical protein